MSEKQKRMREQLKAIEEENRQIQKRRHERYAVEAAKATPPKERDAKSFENYD